MKHANKENRAVAAPRSKKVRKVPNFRKLHQQWQSSFEQGKACQKKPCTKVEAFDITRSGTKFQTLPPDFVPYGQSKEHNRGTSQDYESKKTARPQRKILSELNEAFEIHPEEEFEEDENALKSILQNTGIASLPSSRVTCDPVSSECWPLRPSIYYDGRSRHKVCFSEVSNRVVSRTTLDPTWTTQKKSHLASIAASPHLNAVESTPVRNSIYVRYSRKKADGTSKVEKQPKPNLGAAVRTPRIACGSSAVRFDSTGTLKNTVKWADVLKPQCKNLTEPKDKVAVTLFENDEENETPTKSSNISVDSASASPSPDRQDGLTTGKLQQDFKKLQELEELERNLQIEIEVMKAVHPPSFDSTSQNKHQGILGQSPHVLQSNICGATRIRLQPPHNMGLNPQITDCNEQRDAQSPVVSQSFRSKVLTKPFIPVTFSTSFSQFQTPCSSNIAKREISPSLLSSDCGKRMAIEEDLNQSICDTQKQYGRLEAEADQLKDENENSDQILQQLIHIRQQQQQVIQLQADLQRRLAALPNTVSLGYLQKSLPLFVQSPVTNPARITAVKQFRDNLLQKDVDIENLNRRVQYVTVDSPKRSPAVTPRSITMPRSPLVRDHAIGSLSLAAHLDKPATQTIWSRSHFQPSPTVRQNSESPVTLSRLTVPSLPSLSRSVTSYKFYDGFLDEECALYTGRLHTPTKFCNASIRCTDPVAKVLLYGDDMHFCPIEEACSVIRLCADSAFKNYSMCKV